MLTDHNCWGGFLSTDIMLHNLHNLMLAVKSSGISVQKT